MRTIFSLGLAMLILLAFSPSAYAQTVEAEKTYTITGKSKRGTLGDAFYDPAQKTYTLTYVTKANDRKAKFQIYTFDYDFNFLDMTEDEIEFEKAKTKYKWFKYQGELYSTQGLYVEPNLTGTLVLREKKITHKFDWFFLGYYTTTDVLQKLKPKTDDGRKYFYHGHAEDNVSGDATILVGIKDKMKKGADPYSHFKNFVVMKVNQDVEILNETSFSFDYPMTPVFTRYISDAEGGVGGMVFVFAPMGGPGMGKVADPNKNNYAYVRVDAKPEVVDNIRFDSYAPYWPINEMVVDYSSDAVYLFGPSAMGKDKYYNQLTSTSKFKAVQLMKVSDNKIEYFTETDLPEFEAKLKKPADQKKAPAYEGKKFAFASYKIASNGDFIVSGQRFKPSKEGNQYNDIVGFHFDSKGKLKAQYSVDTKESNKYAKANGTEQFFTENIANTRMYWFQLEIVGVAMARGKMLSYPSIGYIDLGNDNISNFISLGGEEGYYLDPSYPYLATDGESKIVFFGSDKKGKEIWFARVMLD